MDKPGPAGFQSRGRRLLREFSGQGNFGRIGMNAPHDTNRHNRISAYAFNLADGLGTKSYWQGRMETPKDTISAGSWVHIVARYDLHIYSRALPDNEISALYSECDPAEKIRAAAAAIRAPAPGAYLVRIHSSGKRRIHKSVSVPDENVTKLKTISRAVPRRPCFY